MSRIILVVEEHKGCRDALEIALAKLPEFAVHAVATAEQALALLDRAEVCALITDLHMERMDGFELISHIRADPRHAALPILVVSGDTDPATPARLAGIGANAFFGKPFSPAAVRSKLEQLVNAN
jgi:CheY-like chemotaxis protein